MSDLTRYTTNKDFVDFIKSVGFNYYATETKKKYYSTKKGKQIKIDFDFGIITLMNSKGHSVSCSTNFTNVQINDFIKLNI